MTHIIANEIPMRSPEENPFRALQSALALSSNDWGRANDFAWIYGIVNGWADEDNDAYPEMQAKFGWSDAQVRRLRRLHEEFAAAAWGDADD